jgi:cadmium resistance protein CadD (predicted permease)
MMLYACFSTAVVYIILSLLSLSRCDENVSLSSILGGRLGSLLIVRQCLGRKEYSSEDALDNE